MAVAVSQKHCCYADAHKISKTGIHISLSTSFPNTNRNTKSSLKSKILLLVGGKLRKEKVIIAGAINTTSSRIESSSSSGIEIDIDTQTLLVTVSVLVAITLSLFLGLKVLLLLHSC